MPLTEAQEKEQQEFDRLLNSYMPGTPIQYRKGRTNENLKITNAAEERLRVLSLKTPEQREQEQREFDLKMFGRSYAEAHKRDVVTGDTLFSELEIRAHSTAQRKSKLKCHSSEPIRQRLKVY